MQRGRSTLDSFPETMDLNQGSVASNTATNQSAPRDNLLNPVESRLSNHMLSSGERSISCTSTSSHNARSFSGWDPGESSSNTNLQDRIYEDNFKLGHVWSTSMSARANPDIRMQACQSEPSSALLRESENSYGGNHMTRRVLNMLDSGSNGSPLNTDLCGGYMGDNDGRRQGTGTGSSNLYWPGRSETQETSSYGTSSDNFGVSSGSSSYLVENGDGSGSSLGAWGSSCKRKALEGSPAQSYAGGSSSSNPQAEIIARHTVPARYNASSGINISSSPVNGGSSQPEQLNSIIGGGMRTASEIFPPLSMTGNTESSAGNVNGRLHLGHQEPDLFSLPFTETALRPSSSSSSHQPSRSFSATGSSMLMNPPNPLNQSHITHVPGFARSMLPFPWNGSLDSQGSSSSDSFMFSGDRGAGFRDEQNSRSYLRNNLENPAFVSASETRTLVQDPTTWNLTTGNSRSSRSVPSSSRSGPGSSTRTLPTVWTPHQNPTTHNQQGITEYAPWTLFPPLEPEYGVQRGHLPLMPPTSSSEEAVMLSSSSRRRHHQYSRSALLMDAPGDAINGWRALAVDIEGRHRLIRQVLNAVRRGDNLRAQDFTVFDPFISGVAELHDRHSNMRLDVDNMSYEELLALEERIGNVSTGLTEEIIMRSMKQRKYQSVGSSSNSEPCCICQEEYVAGNDVGTLDCGHEFHTNCIKQWLSLKNLCPICKMTALET